MKILYIDPIFGMSGDMMISALIGAGFPFQEIEALLGKLPLKVPAVKAVTRTQNVISGIQLDIEESDIHLSIAEMESIIDSLEVDEQLRTDVREMLEIILRAESKIHGTSREELHLHELSHIDTIIDLLCVARGIQYLGVNKVYCGPVPCGRGTIKTAHGIIPNPPPVTLEILSGHSLVFYDEPLELTTPTGATIVRHYVKERGVVPPFVVEKTGYGVGSYTSERPDVLRVFVGSTGEGTHDEGVEVIEFDVDDMETEYLGAVAERIREAGALDVLYFPVFMKKGRPGIRFVVMMSGDASEKFVDLIFKETTTFGMRIRKEARRVLKREEKIAETSFGPVRIKRGYDPMGNLLKTHIEFEDIKSIADDTGVPYRNILEAIRAEMAEKT